MFGVQLGQVGSDVARIGHVLPGAGAALEGQPAPRAHIQRDIESVEVLVPLSVIACQCRQVIDASEQ